VTALLNWIEQVVVVARLNLQTLWERRGSSAAAVFGIGCVVAVLVGVLSIAQGFQRTMTAAGSPDTAIVLRGGADAEMMSALTRDETRIIADAPGVLRAGGDPLASAEVFVIVNLPKRSTGTDANVPFRGVEPAAFPIRDEVKITRGRMFEWGRNEILAGAGAAQEFAGLDVGSKLRLGKDEWVVVGIFSADGGIPESELWTDATVLQAAYQRGTYYQSVYARLDSADSFRKFKDALTADPRLKVDVTRERDFYAEQSRFVTGLITTLGTSIVLIMAIGAVVGALNTMYTAVAARTREIATLRALGFRGGPIMLSVLAESFILAALGGSAGGGLAYFLCNGFRTATMNWQSFSQVAFAFEVTPRLLTQGIVWALAIGFVGGLFPAIRAVRLPLYSALREN
jgi:putative ABC transport system permease protein